MGQCLHTQASFFLWNLSFPELLLMSVVVPKMLVILPGTTPSQSPAASSSPTLLPPRHHQLLHLSCRVSGSFHNNPHDPFCYETLMGGHVCSPTWAGLLASWVSLISATPSSWVSLPLSVDPSGIVHFSCDSWPFLRLSCGDTCLLELPWLVLSTSVLLEAHGADLKFPIPAFFPLFSGSPQLLSGKCSSFVLHTLQWWSSLIAAPFFSTSICQRLSPCCSTKGPRSWIISSCPSWNIHLQSLQWEGEMSLRDGSGGTDPWLRDTMRVTCKRRYSLLQWANIWFRSHTGNTL